MLGTGLTHVDINWLIVNWPVTIRKLYETLVVVAWKSSYCRRSLKDHSTGDADLMFLQNRGNDHQNSFRWVVGQQAKWKWTSERNYLNWNAMSCSRFGWNVYTSSVNVKGNFIFINVNHIIILYLQLIIFAADIQVLSDKLLESLGYS